MRALGTNAKLRTPGSGSALEASLVEKVLGLALVLALVAGSILILRPFLPAIFLAVVLCVSTWPLFRRMEAVLKGRRTLAALIMAAAIVLILAVPIVVLGSTLADNVARLSEAVRGAIERGVPPPTWVGQIPFVGFEAERIWTAASQQGAGLGDAIAPYVGPVRDWALRQSTALLAGTAQIVLAIVLALFLYRDGPQAEKRLEQGLVRIGGWRARNVLKVAGSTISGVTNGVLGTALVQAILLGISFRIAGVPGAFVLGALAMVLTLVPFGLALIWLPAALWLLSTGETGWAVFILVWNGVFVGNLDNVLRPYLIGRGTRMPGILTFLGVLGGIIAFGLLGVFIGPILLAVAYTLIRDWERVRTAEL
ncbi:AI-2E family transporter [Microvirga thermotolerans]|uniref:AI-2E family transporter n=1 Tax=Microvirga thermotolerans TaxID=2651334 RepID=A0A5P9JSP1_9HYPH|nr:AI-2E family transporter [Microvirga thermotolerans]QFU14788.1 AI-2E family transporter [Microvirga thermotolerans]